jgi:hypothetical protein
VYIVKRQKKEKLEGGQYPKPPYSIMPPLEWQEVRFDEEKPLGILI